LTHEEQSFSICYYFVTQLSQLTKFCEKKTQLASLDRQLGIFLQSCLFHLCLALCIYRPTMMKTSSFRMLASLMAVMFMLLPKSQGFSLVTTRPRALAHQSTATKLYLASQIETSMEEQELAAMGPTERLLLEAKKRRDSGIIQEYGRTVMNDHLDGVRELIWSIFKISNWVFLGLGICMVAAMALNVAGYGYYIDDNAMNLHIDTLENIRQSRYFEEEMARVSDFAMTHKH
jgi:hypothetical protein